MKYFLFTIFLSLSFPDLGTAQSSNKVIIFWYGMGSGHRIPAERIADYVTKAFNKKSMKVTVILKDMREFSLYDKGSEEKGKKKYLAWAQKESESYTKYFEWHLEKEPHKIKSNFNLYQISKYLIREKPRAIVTVFWGAAHALYTIKSIFADSFKTPVSLLYTDYGVRKFVFMVPTVDKIFLGSKSLYLETFKKYPKLKTYQNNFDFSGIPINWERIKELKKMPISKVKKNLGLEPKAQVIALARGGEAFLSFTGIINKLAPNLEKQGVNYQILALTGKSIRDKADLEKLQKKFPGRIKIVGYIKNETYLAYVRASDIFVTKPGGVGLTEAGLLETPLIIMQGLGGQENDNRDEFVKYKMAFSETSENKIVNRINYIIANKNVAKSLIDGQKKYFAEYNPPKIANWTLNARGISDWAKYAKDLEDTGKKKKIQEQEELDPISLRNWFFYLNEVALSDISKSKKFQKEFQKKAHTYMNIAIKNNRKKIKQYKQEIKKAKGKKTRSLYVTKWELFTAIIMDQSFHINLNKPYTHPDRQLLDSLVKDLLEFLDTDIFAKQYAIWEFTKGSLYSYLSNFYFMAKNINLAQKYITLSLKEFPKDNTGETIIQIQGDIYQRRKKDKEAVKFFERYLSYNPHMDGIRISLAKIYDDLNMVPKAESEFKKIFSRSSKHLENEYFQFASFYMRNKQKEKALNILFQGVKDRPDSISLTSLLIRLIMSTPEFKAKYPDKLKELINKYKKLQQIELKKLEELPLLFED